MSKNLLNLLHHHNAKPIIQAPMAGVQDSKLAIAVCQSGGVGSLPCALISLEKVEQEINAIRIATDMPFNVNFFVHKNSEYTDSVHQNWLKTLQPYYDKLQVDNQNIPLTGGRKPFDKAQAELIAELKVPIVSFHFGLPDDNLLNIVKQSGAKILSTATTINEAKFLISKGVDGIIAQGLESGGHRGIFLDKDLTTQTGTFSLLPNIAKLLKSSNSDIMLIGTGGISDSATVTSAFELGADLVQVGTAFLLADECNTTLAHRAMLQSEQAQHTALTNIFSGGIARGIVTPLMAELGFINNTAPDFPNASFVLNPLKNADNQTFSSFWAGQNAPLAKTGSAKQIIENLFTKNN
nr:nitronate monooxygenase [uncultured Moraxella sp.]